MAIRTADDPPTDDTPVIGIRIVAHQVSSTGFNHWSIYLRTPDGGATQMNMTATANNRTGNLVWSKHSKDEPNSIVLAWDWPVSANAKITNFMNAISQCKRESYTFPANSDGCRHWIATVLSDFVDHNLIKDEVSERMVGNMCYRYYLDACPTWLPIIPGTFAKEINTENSVLNRLV
ncbi:predicted protein [Histoplasma capsulatum G186AR]|uniref:DUF7770 domain-containing protein n=2 Tax=Ajellomyces capsulatus TaxID=5037 RepID=C0NV95_AJECG|nr:uncharacterized protein HCBG_07075 [Histoplasma capsulatum G186AR]EEH04434.1 predicted protein [Histoplasma capsulatum G186AR]KAG5296266.1 hypothetical protein I7I52_06868 [Histoplasma capsulatum]QSS74248.1 hypothetical protein I7I50_09347 [Histoplasma capsulatum G186AR]